MNRKDRKNRRTKGAAAFLAGCLILLCASPAFAVETEHSLQMAEAAEPVEISFAEALELEPSANATEPADFTATAEEELVETVESEEQSETHLLASPEDMITVVIDAPVGHKDELGTLDAPFSSADGVSLRALIGSTTGENRAAILAALSDHFESSSGVPLKLVHGDLIDVEKWNRFPDEDPFSERLQDHALCWAASTCGALWSAGWARSVNDPATGAPFVSEDAFFTWFSEHFINRGGEAKSALDWFFDGTYLESGFSGSPWSPSDKNEGSFPQLMSDCLYEAINIVNDPGALSVMERLSANDGMPAFEASIGALTDGIAGASDHSVTALGLITDPSAAGVAEKYKAILLADPDNDADPTIPAEEATDEERIADRAARPNSYTVYPLKLITDAAGKKCWQIVGYGSDAASTYVLFELLFLSAKTESVMEEAAETEGSCDVTRDADFLISDGLTSDAPPAGEMLPDEAVTEFSYGEDVYFIFRLKNKGVIFDTAGEDLAPQILLTLTKDGKKFGEELRTLSVMRIAPMFFKQCLSLTENTALPAGNYTLTAEIDPEVDGKRYPESYYRNNRPVVLTFTVTGGPQPDPPEPDPEPEEPLFTGTPEHPVANGIWKQDEYGRWHYMTIRLFRDTWAYIVNPYAGSGQHGADWFRFDAAGNMLTGWQLIGGKWYYLNPASDGTLGACYLGPGRTPDGYEVDVSGAWTGR